MDFITALGRVGTAQVKKAAAIDVAEGDRDYGIIVSDCERAAAEATLHLRTKIETNVRTANIKQVRGISTLYLSWFCTTYSFLHTANTCLFIRPIFQSSSVLSLFTVLRLGRIPPRAAGGGGGGRPGPQPAAPAGPAAPGRRAARRAGSRAAQGKHCSMLRETISQSSLSALFLYQMTRMLNPGWPAMLRGGAGRGAGRAGGGAGGGRAHRDSSSASSGSSGPNPPAGPGGSSRHSRTGSGN